MDYPKSVPSVGLVGGKFVDEDPLAGTPGSLIPAQWGNGVTEEILHVIEGGGLVPDEFSNTQLLAAIRSLNQEILIKQMSAVVGVVRNARMAVAVASSSASYTVDEIGVKSALGGAAWMLSNVNKSINLAAVGAGGMDVGLAPVSGFVAVYVIYNPTTSQSALLGVNTTATLAPETCSGVLPSGYTASALVSVWPTNASRQFVIGTQIDRSITLAPTVALSVSSSTSTFTVLSVASIIPKNAKTISGLLNVSSSTSSAITLGAAGNASNTGMVDFTANILQRIASFVDVPLFTPQTMYYQMSSGGTPTAVMTINRYSF